MAVTTGTMLAVSTAVSMAGALAQGVAAKRAANVQAQQEEHIAAQQREQASREAERIRRAGERTQGQARAQMAASGIRVDSGTALQIDEEIGFESELDAQNTLLTGERGARASEFSASVARARGANAKTGSILSAVGTGVGAGLQGWKGVKQPARGHATFAEGEY